MGMANPNPKTEQIEAYQFNSGNAAANGRKGAYAANKIRRKKKAYQEIAMRVLNSSLDPTSRKKVEKITGELENDENTLYAAALAQMVAKAVQGDTRAFREIQNVIEKAQGGAEVMEREDDPLSDALKQIGESL